MDKIVNKELKKSGRFESFMKKFINKTPKNIFRLFFVFSLVLIGSFIFTNKANAATYTVCASGCSYATLASAESGATDGDTVNVSTGTYSQAGLTLTKGISWVAVDGIGTVTITRSTSGAQDVIIALGDGAMSFNGFVFDGTTNTTTSVVHIQNNANNKTFTNCSFLATGGTPAQLVNLAGTATGTVFTNPTFSGTPSVAGITSANASITMTGLTVYNFTSAKFFNAVAGAPTFSAIGGSITASLSGETFFFPSSGDTTVSGITAILTPNVTAPSSFVRLGSASLGTKTALVTNNIITYSGTNSLNRIIYSSGGSFNLTVSGNTITAQSTLQARGAIDVIDTPILNVLNNVINFGGTTLNDGSFVPIKIQSSGTTMAVTVTSNSVTSPQTSFQIILVGTDTSSAGDNKIDGAIIQNNKVYGLSNSNVHDIEYGYNKNGVVTGNYVYGGRYGIVIKGNDTYTAGLVAYNVFKDQVFEQLRVKGIKNLPVYNNTFYLSSGRTIANGQLYITVNAESGGVASTGTVAKNNLFYSQANQSTVNSDADSSVGLVLNNNLHYSGGTFKSIIGATTYTNWNDWGIAGFDSSGINSNPLLASPLDFRLEPTSPAINAGTNVSLTSDYLGNPIVGIPDIGAYEFQAPTAPHSSSGSSGSSVSSRYTNLINMGNIQAAQELAQQFPNQFSNNQIPTPPTQTISIITPAPSTPLTLLRILKLVTPRVWGDDVLALQTLLNTKGYDSGTPDRNFGPKTQAAVIAFQKANGLVPDGSVGPNTLKYLNVNQTITTTSPIQPTVVRTLRLSIPRMIGDDVKSLQTYLSTNGYDVGTPDGIFGTKTQSAVIAFQTANNLNPDGLVGAKTREMMK